MSKMDAHRINAILEQIQGWERGGVMRFGSNYGRQKGFKRTLLSVNQQNKNHILGVNQVQKIDENEGLSVNQVKNYG